MDTENKHIENNTKNVLVNVEGLSEKFFVIQSEAKNLLTRMETIGVRREM